MPIGAAAQTGSPPPARPQLQGRLPPTPGSGLAFAGLGPLAGKVEAGQSGAWQVQDDGGKLVLSNPNAAGAVRFYVTDWQGDLQAGRSVSLRVSGRSTGALSGAGIVFHVSDGDPRWLTFAETAEGKLVVYARSPTELKRLGTFDIPGGHRADGDLLQLNQRPGLAQFLANGRIVTELNDGNGLDPTMPAPVGVIAMGQGDFTFDGFAFGPAIVPAQSPRMAGDDTLPPPRTAGDDTLPTTPGKPDAPQTRTPLRSFTADTFGALFGIMAHEFGHFMIGELKIPATGPEEDVADEFAAMVFIDNFKDAFETSKALAIGNAKLWWYMAQDHGDGPPFYDEHAPDKARFAKFSCMLYGAAPVAFEALMDAAEIPDRTKQRCKMDEPKRHTAWNTLLRPFRRDGVDPNFPGDIPAGTPGHKVTVVYEQPKDPALRPYAEELRRSGIFETIADSLNKLYLLPRDTKLVFRDCGVENCFYNPQDGSVTMCWEMISFVMNEFRKHGEGVPNPTPAPNPGPNSGGQTMSLDQLLMGRWRSQSVSNGITTVFQLGPQGIYEAQIQGANQGPSVSIRGRWTVQPGNGGAIQLTFQPQQWYPPQICNGGYCQLVSPTPMTVGLQIVDHNTMRSQDGMVTRMQ